MKNPAAHEVLAALHARGVSLWRIAARPEGGPQAGGTTQTPRWRAREEQWQLLWLLGWEWMHERHPVCITTGQAIGQRLLVALAALRQCQN
ncbi:MAG TPA: hypothetical protein VKJ47_07580 [Candidatus Binatia bacterium]|nr:hypothetical protein [Candidatus Binatia bacterium]